MAQDDLIDLHFVGQEVVLTELPARTLAAVLRTVDDLVVSVIMDEQPFRNRDDLIVGFQGLLDGGRRIQFTCDPADLLLRAYMRVARAVTVGAYGDVPVNTLRSLRGLVAFARQHECEIELGRRQGHQVGVFAVLRPDTHVPNVPRVRGVTTLYGQVVRVGGRRPRVMVETVDGQTVYCDVAPEVARELGRRLYTQVGVYGEIRWDGRDMSMRNGHVERLTDYGQVRIDQSILELEQQIGQHYADVADVERYVSALRR